MCGIFGIVISAGSNFDKNILNDHLKNLYILSESRGKEASGIAVRHNHAIDVLKAAIPASKFVRSNEYQSIIQNVVEGISKEGSSEKCSIAAIGHSRLVTNGRQDLDLNNQPVIKDGAVCIHNGIIVNDNELWTRNPDLTRSSDIDTEVLVSLLQMFRRKGNSLIQSTRNTFTLIEGAASIAVLFEDTDNLLLATNTGSLYTATSNNGDFLVFASEKYILEQLTRIPSLTQYWKESAIQQVKPFSGCVVDISSLKITKFSFTTDADYPDGQKSDSEKSAEIKVHSMINSDSGKIINSVPTIDTSNKERVIFKINGQRRPDDSLKRCTRCILPETFPFIEFDEQGVCNFCRDHKKMQVKGPEALEHLISPFRSESGEPDCIVGFSGGRDSSYLLHYVKKILKMNPIAYTYDWGMVTDLGRRNQARMCGKLGIEHILISADIEQKRENIRKNIQAWLKRPDLGMIPILMAGDKQFYYFAHQLMEQTGVKIIFSGGNAFERTGFKLGFCGIRESDTTGKGILTGISAITKLKLLSYYGKQYLLNPAYINSSIFDTFHAYYSSYLLPDAYVYFFNYIHWDEKEIVSTLRREYDWEMAIDTNTTWRIGDGTAPFYDYIYYTVAGFSEFDTFRSNQIREGLISREEALKLVTQENIPRYESLEWYAQTNNFNLEEALDVIHAIPKLYKI
jgi:asparagine synthetase B (glutamine-hydrolysing)